MDLPPWFISILVKCPAVANDPRVQAKLAELSTIVSDLIAHGVPATVARRIAIYAGQRYAEQQRENRNRPGHMQ